MLLLRWLPSVAVEREPQRLLRLLRLQPRQLRAQPEKEEQGRKALLLVSAYGQ